MKQPFILTLVSSVACAATAANKAPENTTPTKSKTPNVVFIYADDLGYGDLECYGAKNVQTPNVNRLAKSGILFTNAHATAATSTPSRYSMLTGEYAWRKEGTDVAAGNAGMIIEERMYSTVQGPWYYFTADDGQIDLVKHDYLGIGTLESYLKLKAYFGEQAMVPLYVEVDDGLRLSRALERERKQTEPKYAEMCRRFLADCEDFTEEKIAEAGIVRRFSNNSTPEDCFSEIQNFVEQQKKL